MIRRLNCCEGKGYHRSRIRLRLYGCRNHFEFTICALALGITTRSLVISSSQTYSAFTFFLTSPTCLGLPCHCSDSFSILRDGRQFYYFVHNWGRSNIYPGRCHLTVRGLLILVEDGAQTGFEFRSSCNSLLHGRADVNTGGLNHLNMSCGAYMPSSQQRNVSPDIPLSRVRQQSTCD